MIDPDAHLCKLNSAVERVELTSGQYGRSGDKSFRTIDRLRTFGPCDKMWSVPWLDHSSSSHVQSSYLVACQRSK